MGWGVGVRVCLLIWIILLSGVIVWVVGVWCVSLVGGDWFWDCFLGVGLCVIGVFLGKCCF